MNFDISEDFGTIFLKRIKDSVIEKDFSDIAINFEAYEDLNYSLEECLRPLIRCEFPAFYQKSYVEFFLTVANEENVTMERMNNIFEQNEIASIQWSIAESARIDQLIRSPFWVRIYLSSLFIFCDKLEVPLYGEGVVGEYYFLIVESALCLSDPKITILLSRFLEWLHAHVPNDGEHDNDNYFSLLSWLLLRRLAGGTEKQIFNDVKKELLSRKSTINNISFPSMMGGESTWLKLHQAIPLRYGATKNEFDLIINGTVGSL